MIIPEIKVTVAPIGEGPKVVWFNRPYFGENLLAVYTF
jgi:hypothetical protein